mmetsp:Transcript_6055/g.15004  ORF Transcript_6055/g.15004 Transcript_6055/m.15004 type:complete len:226 (-) Transcript_6055:173-850(-)
MIAGERSCNVRCGYVLKVLMILLASTGVILSVVASNSCRFLYLEHGSFSDFDPVFNDKIEGWNGIFKYQVIANIDEDIGIEECSFYEKLFDINAPNESLLVSQLSAILAPSFGLIAILVSIMELSCHRSFRSFIASSVLFLAASFFQFVTFGILLSEQDRCFDSFGCKFGKAAYLSLSAVFAFYISCILLCCSPRPNSCTLVRKEVKHNDCIPQLKVVGNSSGSL